MDNRAKDEGTRVLIMGAAGRDFHNFDRRTVTERREILLRAGKEVLDDSFGVPAALTGIGRDRTLLGEDREVVPAGGEYLATDVLARF